MPKDPASGNGTALPDLSDLHTKTLYLHGLMAVLTDFDPHDRRTSNGAAAVVFVAEGLADEIAKGMEKLMDGIE
ncbi:hypothetical protein KUV73_20405 [Mameliella alba]|nr:hypothetical protein [Mameliella alba]MBY6171521.1 hypothetical protein [Mameliella alba]MBY6176745.1 hypothetical protein [Mameliella alba]